MCRKRQFSLPLESAYSGLQGCAEQRTVTILEFICTIRFSDDLSRWVQPPDSENCMSGGVGGITGTIPLSPPDQLYLSALLRADLQTFTPFRFQNFQPKMLRMVYYQPEIELLNSNQWLLFSNSTKAWTMTL